MIKESTIARIMDTAQIEDVVEDYVVLKKRGANLLGLCPFHNEKTPSFTVSPSKNIYKCFGCGKAGNSVGFLMEHDGMSYPEALRTLAKRYGIEVEETQRSPEDIEQQNLADSLYIVNEFAQKLFSDNLYNHQEGQQVGLPYFKERGFLEKTIKKFDLGFAVKSSAFLKELALQKGYKLDLLRQVGLVSERGFDFFRDRVMFPIHSMSGKVIAFGGRTLKKDKKIPKYINSPESPIYVKNKVLYGIYQAKTSIRKSDQCLLVEGYTDVISLHQGGIENVVASSGTSLTEGQIRLIKRNTENIIILYDGDLAGIKAALRGIDLILEQDMNVKVVLLPDGQDPDSYIQLVGKTEFEKYIEERGEDFILFKTNLLKEDAVDDPVKLSKVITDIVRSIARVPNAIKRELYVRQCSKVLEINEQVLTTDVNRNIYEYARQKRRQAEAEKRRSAAKRKNVNINTANNTSSKDNFFPSEEPNYTGESSEDQFEEPYDPPFDTLQPTPSRAPDQRKQYKLNDEFQERDIIRILICGGAAPFDEEERVTVGQYLINNLSDIINHFDNPLYLKIFQIFIDKTEKGENVDLSTWVNHTENEISKLAIDLSTSRFEMSENWDDKGVGLQNQLAPEMNYVKDATHSILRIKSLKIKRLININHEKIKNYDPENIVDGEDLALLLKIHGQLKGTLNDLAAKYGTVVLG